jgi:DMSO/TMAO reductase YedYZ molybdopterin-dependent catalytic subunit
MSITRRLFLQGSAGTFSLAFVQGCGNTVVPRDDIQGVEFPFLTPVETDNLGRTITPQSGNFFRQFGAISVPDLNFEYDDVPVVAPEDWTFTVSGLGVTTPLSVDLADLQARTGQIRRLVKTIRCVVDNLGVPGLVGTGIFTGVPLRFLLEEAGVDLDAARRLRLFGRDGFANNLRVDEVTDPAALDRLEPMLAFEMNDAPILHPHGGPVRLIVPGEYGYKQLKWLDRVEATTDDAEFGSYQSIGFFDAGDIGTYTKVSNPIEGARLDPGPVRVFGYGINGSQPVTEVEISIDGGEFRPTRIVSETEILAEFPQLADAEPFSDPDRFYPYPDVWSIFTFDWDAPAGDHTLQFRSITADGTVQDEDDNDPADGNTGWFTVRVTVG